MHYNRKKQNLKYLSKALFAANRYSTAEGPDQLLSAGDKIREEKIIYLEKNFLRLYIT